MAPPEVHRIAWFTGSWGHRKFHSAWLNLDPPRHLILFNRTILRAAAEKQGFTVERLDSTIRSAWVYGALSGLIARTGRAEMSQLGKPSNLLRGIAFQTGERIRKWFDREAGDELLLIARKPA